MSAGTVINSYGMYISEVAGAGAITNNYGIYIENLSKGSGGYAIKTAGVTPSSFGGAVDVVGAFTAGTIQADNGFTGTGAYTNFTIVGGVITAAS